MYLELFSRARYTLPNLPLPSGRPISKSRNFHFLPSPGAAEELLDDDDDDDDEEDDGGADTAGIAAAIASTTDASIADEEVAVEIVVVAAPAACVDMSTAARSAMGLVAAASVCGWGEQEGAGESEGAAD